MRLKLFSIPSVVPGWYDPDAPGFHPPKSWKSTRVRVRFPVTSDPLSETREMRTKLEKQYPGANLVIIPEFQHPAAAEEMDIKGGDEAVLRNYLKEVTPPEESTREQMEVFIRKYLPFGGAFGIQGVRFGKVTASNVLCFEKAEADFDQKGLTLVTGTNHDWPGSNGAGKSSLATLPFLALFGRTFKNQTFDGWARQGNKDAAGVGLRLTLADGRQLRVVRGRRPNNFRAYLDDKEITMGDANATQAAIERLTNLTWSVLTNAVYVGQREIGSVFGTEKERKELFSRLLGLERFLDAEAKIRKALLKCKRAVEEVEGDVASAASALQEARGGMDEIAKALASSATVTSTDLTLKESELITQQASAQRAQKDIDRLEEELAENQRAFEKVLFSATDLEVRIQQLQERRDSLSGLTGECPTCGERVDIRRLEKSIRQLSTQMDSLELDWSALDEKQRSNRTERKLKADKLQAKRQEWEKAAARHSAVSIELSKAREQLEARQRLEGLLQRKRERVTSLQKAHSIHEQARLACVYEQRFVEACLATVGRDGLPAFLASIAAPALNAAAQRYSEIFSDGKIGIRFEMSGGEIDVKIQNDSGGAEFKDQSAGESRMAGIITAFAFRETMVPHNVLVLDEPGEGLDATNAAAFARGLSKTVERFQHIVIVSHNPYILSELEPDREWQVEKRNGVATVKEV